MKRLVALAIIYIGVMGIPVSGQVITPMQQATLRSMFQQLLGYSNTLNGALITTSSIPANRVIGTALTAETFSEKDPVFTNSQAWLITAVDISAIRYIDTNKLSVLYGITTNDISNWQYVYQSLTNNFYFTNDVAATTNVAYYDGATTGYLHFVNGVLHEVSTNGD